MNAAEGAARAGAEGGGAEPRPAPRRFEIALEEGPVAGWRWCNDGARPLLFAHANGFCASAYKRLLSLLSDAFDVIAIDLRGHGRTRLPAQPSGHATWTPFVDDLGRVMDSAGALGLSSDARWVLAGHSLGASSLIRAAVGRSDVARICALEPVAVPALVALYSALPGWRFFADRSPLVRGALNRRSAWSSRDEVRQRYRNKKIFALFAEDVIDDYLEDGLVEGAEGVRLACDPEWEAANFAASQAGFWRAVARLDAPLDVLGANHPSSTLIGDAPARFTRAGAQVQLLDGVTHLAPLEVPEAAARFICEAAAS